MNSLLSREGNRFSFLFFYMKVVCTTLRILFLEKSTRYHLLFFFVSLNHIFSLIDFLFFFSFSVWFLFNEVFLFITVLVEYFILLIVFICFYENCVLLIPICSFFFRINYFHFFLWLFSGLLWPLVKTNCFISHIRFLFSDF